MQAARFFGLIVLAVVVAGCGGHGASNNAAPTTAPATTTASTPAGGGAGALQAEATAKATGDIPDNQVFLTFVNTAAGYSMKYPEGWAQKGSGKTVTISDKNNIVRIVVANAPQPTAASVRKDVAALSGVQVAGGPTALTIAGKPAFKVTYRTQSAANAVTGKRVTLVVDRYYVWTNGKEAIVDLGTPVGVDNVDAYRMMIASFKWK
jgi:hypothetical protein